jgi:hypothetical protein
MKWFWRTLAAVLVLAGCAVIYLNWFYNPCAKGCTVVIIEPNELKLHPNLENR